MSRINYDAEYRRKIDAALHIGTKLGLNVRLLHLMMGYRPPHGATHHDLRELLVRYKNYDVLTRCRLMIEFDQALDATKPDSPTARKAWLQIGMGNDTIKSSLTGSIVAMRTAVDFVKARPASR